MSRKWECFLKHYTGYKLKTGNNVIIPHSNLLIRRLSKTLCISFYITLCDECVHISWQLLLQIFHFLVSFHYLQPFHKISIHPTVVGAGDTLKTWCNLACDIEAGEILCNRFLIKKLLHIGYSLTKFKSLFTSYV